MDLDTAEAKWRQQFAAMQAALSELPIPQAAPELNGELSDEDFGGYSSADGGQDVWDFISEEDDAGDSSDFVEADGADGSPEQGLAWFEDRSAVIATKNGLPAADFQDQILALVSSSRSDDELQNSLTDLVGFDDFDFIIELLAQKHAIVNAHAQDADRQGGGQRLLNRAEREAALQRQDREHKSAALAPSYAREPQYPHVYRSYAAGNTLSATGKKYGLPDGHERKQFDKYEEYFIPAARKGTLAPGRQLVEIASLDGLCRGTFKGYQALNRMQSLVYPVGYKTSENMLICAPTGAVSARQKGVATKHG